MFKGIDWKEIAESKKDLILKASNEDFLTYEELGVLLNVNKSIAFKIKKYLNIKDSKTLKKEALSIKVLELYNNGVKVTSIVKQLNTHHEIVYDILRKLGLATGFLDRNLKHDGFTGHEGLQGKYWYNIKRGAESRNLDFSISIEYAWSLYLTQDKKCAISGRPIHMANSFKELSSGLNEASLDRIDSSKGYIEGNVQWIHKDINFMKQDYPDEYFRKTCCEIADLENFKYHG